MRLGFLYGWVGADGGARVDKQLAQVAGLEIGQDFVPMDVKIETLAGMVVALFGALLNAGTFEKIDGSASMNQE